MNAPVLCVLIVYFLSGCTAMKFVPEDKVLYTGSEVKLIPTGRVRAKSKIKELLYNNINPEPNASIFGMRPQLWIYFNTETKKKKGLKNFIKNKIGKPPVYLSDVDPDKTANLLKGHLINNGYFQSDVKSETIVKNKKGKVKYTAYVQRPYRLRKIATPVIDTLFADIDSIKAESILKKGQRYNLERLQAEQQRIEEALENLGFYYFDDRHLIFEADSTVGDRRIDLKLKLEPGVPPKAKRIYRLGRINIYPHYTLSLDTTRSRADTIRINGYNYIDGKGDFKPHVITDLVNLRTGKIYRREDREYTLSHLMNLGAFKFVNIKFRESKRDSATLNANIYLTPFLKKSIRAEFQATSKSNNFVGPGLSLTFSNRNALRGSERLDITLTSGYEVQVSRKVATPLNAIELGGTAKLTVPRFVAPVKIHYPTRKYLPTTEMSVGTRLQQRVGYFNLNSFNFSYGYTWRENTMKTHELFPIDFNFVELGNVSAVFQNILDKNRFLARSLENQFIPGARYSYTLNTQLNQERAQKFREREFEPSQFYFNATVEVAGNAIHALQGKSFRQRDNPTEATMLGAVYSQFARSEFDFRHYWQLDKKNKFVTRVDVGVGYAYGNSQYMPYIRQFAIGGSTSIRAFPARSLGPGTYSVFTDPQYQSNQKLIVDQRGDIKIEGNAEYRYDITNTFKGAFFVDAGNIWMMRPDPAPENTSGEETSPARQGVQFDKKTFMKELAVGTGLGLRLDFNFFLLRFDLAFPVRKPWLPDGQRWVFNQIDLRSSRWRGDNLVLNIAIGYPF